MPTIRPAQANDMPAVLDLIRELAVYENAGDQVAVSVEELQRDGFGERPLFEAFVAETEEGIIGMALYYFKYSTWKGKALYLEDIVVQEDHRRKGVGKALFDAVIGVANEHGCRRMEWQVLDWNTPAIRFYEKYGAELDPEWINGQLRGDRIQALARKEDAGT